MFQNLTRILGYFFICLFSSFLLFNHYGCAPSGRYSSSPQKRSDSRVPNSARNDQSYKLNRVAGTVRVLLQEGSTSVSLEIKNTVKLNLDSKDIAIVKKGNKISITYSNEKVVIKIKNKSFFGTILSISPIDFKIDDEKANLDNFLENRLNYIHFTEKTGLKNNSSKTSNDRIYAGIFWFLIQNGAITVVNQLPLDYYILSVIPYELPSNGKKEYIEAFKAFSIVVRNYTLMRLNANNPLFDVYPDVRDQVYRGVSLISEDEMKAYSEVKDLILIHNKWGEVVTSYPRQDGTGGLSNNKVASVFYHAACGGVTEGSGDVFSESLPHLVSIKDSKNGTASFCSTSPNFSWKESFSNKDLLKFFNSSVIKNPRQVGGGSSGEQEVADIEIVERLNSGRVKRLKVFFKNGESLIIDHRNIRNVFKTKDGRILRSTFFDINKEFKGSKLVGVTFIGKGNGHGVGFCQWGSLEMSKQGYKYDEILKHYFPKTEIIRGI